MKSFSEYHAQAREALQNRWGTAAAMQAILIFFPLMITTPSAIAQTLSNSAALSTLSSLGSLLVVPLQLVFYNVLLGAVRSKESDCWNNAWDITRKHYGKFLLAELLRSVIILAVSIVTLLIGGIILSYAYAMVPYLLNDYPELSIREAMKISRQMMRNQKMNLFVLDISFIGWVILSLLTFGIGILFLLYADFL